MYEYNNIEPNNNVQNNNVQNNNVQDNNLQDNNVQDNNLQDNVQDNNLQDNVQDNVQDNLQDNIEIQNIKQTNSVGIQTNYEKYISFKPLPEISDSEYKDIYFKHLVFANQTYLEHFKDAIRYSFISLKASFFFFCHAVWPDIFTKTGSDTIHELSEKIYEKYHNRIYEILEKQNGL
jgi:hypothetical protein